MISLPLVLLGSVLMGPAFAEEPTDPMSRAGHEVEEPDEVEDDGVGVPPMGDPPSPDEVAARTEQLSTELRCPVCQGLSVAASPSEAARAMRDRIEDLVARGYTDEQIASYFVDRYVTWVLLEPPRQGLNWVLWLGPAALVVGGALMVSRRRNNAELPVTPQSGAAPGAADDPWRAAALAEIDGDSKATPGRRP